MKYFLKLFFLWLSLTPVFSLDLQKFRYDFSSVHQIYGGYANDDTSFKLGNVKDDFRTASLIFAYIAPKAFPLSVEFAYHMLTFRGMEATPSEERRRAGVLDTTVLYHWLFPFGESSFELQGGLRGALYGNLGDYYVQDIFHRILGYKRDINFNETPYLGIAYLAGGAEYRWRHSLFMNSHLQVSFMGDIFFRSAFGLDLRNDFLSLETTLYAQAIHFNDRGKEFSVLHKTAQVESGLGLFFKNQSEHVFAYLDLSLWQWDPIYIAGQKYGQNFTRMGFGFRLTKDSHSKDETSSSVDTPVLTGDKWLSENLGFRFGIALPATYTHSLVWVPDSFVPLSLVVGLSFNGARLDNILHASVNWDVWKTSFFGVFLEGGTSLTFGMINPYVYSIWSTPVQGINLGLGVQGQGGIWFRLHQSHAADYRLLLYGGISYDPLYWIKLFRRGGFYKKNIYNYTVGFALEVRPRF